MTTTAGFPCLVTVCAPFKIAVFTSSLKRLFASCNCHTRVVMTGWYYPSSALSSQNLIASGIGPSGPETALRPPTDPDERNERIRFLGVVVSLHAGVNNIELLFGLAETWTSLGGSIGCEGVRN